MSTKSIRRFHDSTFQSFVRKQAVLRKLNPDLISCTIRGTAGGQITPTPPRPPQKVSRNLRSASLSPAFTSLSSQHAHSLREEPWDRSYEVVKSGGSGSSAAAPPPVWAGQERSDPPWRPDRLHVASFQPHCTAHGALLWVVGGAGWGGGHVSGGVHSGPSGWR